MDDDHHVEPVVSDMTWRQPEEPRAQEEITVDVEGKEDDHEEITMEIDDKEEQEEEEVKGKEEDPEDEVDSVWMGGDTGTKELKQKEGEVPTLEYVPKRMSNNDRRPLKKKKRSMANTGMALGRCLYGFIIFLATMSLIMTAIVHIFAWYEEDIEKLESLKPNKIDWFQQPREVKWSEVSCLMEVQWTFWMWIAVFFLQLIWIFYGMVLTCRRTKENAYLYESAATMPCTVYLVFLIGMGATAAWNVFWGQSGVIEASYSQWGTIVIAAGALLFHITLALAVKAFIASISDLRDLKKKYDLGWNQLFTHNGLAAMAAWESVVTMYAITWVLDDRDLVPQVPNFACCVGLALIMFYILVWFILDLIFTKKALYYVFSPYLVVAVAFISALVRNLAMYKGAISENLSLVLSGVFLSVTALFIVIKVITVIVRGRYTTTEKDEVRSLHDDNVYVMQ